MSSLSRLPAAFTAAAAASAPSPRASNLALAAATERVRAVAFGPGDARQLLDELRRRGTRVHERALNDFLAALARAPPSATCNDGPALAVTFFNIMSRDAGKRVMPPSVCTYSILMDCCTRAQLPDLALAFFGQLLRIGLGADEITFNNLLKSLCKAKRTEEALDVVLHRMPELSCVPNVISYNILLKRFCDNRNSGQACELLRRMIEKAAGCSPDVVSYNTQGIQPDLATYNSIIDALCKARAMDKAEAVLSQMADKGVRPNSWTYNSLIHGYSSRGKWKDVVRVFKDMTRRGFLPDIVTWNTCTYNMVLSGLCKNNCSDEAIALFKKVQTTNVKIDIITINVMIAVMFKTRRIEEAKNLFASIAANGPVPSIETYHIMMTNLLKEGLLEEADGMFSSMENACCHPDSRLLNHVVRSLLGKRQVVRAGTYLSKIDEMDFKLEDSTIMLLVDLLSSRGTCREQISFLPRKYQFLSKYSEC
ncbi:hypothetical protein HU200_048678 [Digitaria exilis]|uniref:Pentatricopeptide repeat-containing protein n=1 Tax=Digitaria exilis TaxID=1010633 RepID=A0A835AUG6_9POAL|nr:hypothetical protein HU200_048678 [Digitaria exilis]